MRWEDHEDYEPTETGYSLASGDRVWAAATPAEPGDPDQSFYWLCRGETRAKPWSTSLDRIDGWTPVWGSLGELRAFLAEEEGLPGGRERWMPITIGDYWRWGEGKEPRRVASRKTIAAIEAAKRKEDK